MSIRTIIGAGFAALALATQAALPEGATRLAWIQSSGSQYIDTGIKLKAPSDRVHMVWRCTSIGQGGVMFGNRFTHEKNCFYAHFNSPAWTDAGFAININHNGYENNRWMISLLKNKSFVNELMDIDASLQSITVSYGGASATCEPKNQTAFETIGTCTVLKGVTVEGGTSGNVNGVIGKLYSFQIYRGNYLLIDLVPVRKNDGTLGMYDWVSGEFFGNAGEGSFTSDSPVVTRTDVHSEIWLPLDSTAKLEAVAKQGFLGWTGDVEESEQLVNPLEKTISRGLTITPTFPKPRRGLFVVVK